MIKAYLTAIPTLYEGEDIEIRYSLYQDQIAIKKESIYVEYMKPSIVSGTALLTLLRQIEIYKKEDILVVINDSSLHELIKGSSTTKNGDVIKMGNIIRKRLLKFEHLSFVNVTKDKKGLAEWREILEN